MWWPSSRGSNRTVWYSPCLMPARASFVTPGSMIEWRGYTPGTEVTHTYEEERAAMRVVKIDDLQKEPMGTATPIHGWSGEAVSRSRQTIIRGGESENYRCSVVNFGQGATRGWHAHTCEPIRVITSGTGSVATEDEGREVAVGEVVAIRAGAGHWHGA